MIKKAEKKSIFISYSWANSNEADTIYNLLDDDVFKISIDKKDLNQDGGCIIEYQNTIKTHSKVVGLFSVNYLLKKRCLEELQIILKDKSNKDKLVPVWISKSDFNSAIFENIDKNFTHASDVKDIIKFLKEEGYIKEKEYKTNIAEEIKPEILYEVQDDKINHNKIDFTNLKFSLEDDTGEIIRDILLFHKKQNRI